MPDDLTNDISTAGVLTIGASVDGVFETAQDVDWYAVQLEADIQYVIETRGNFDDGVTPAFSPNFSGLYDAEGQDTGLGYNSGIGIGGLSRVLPTVAQSGTYYISVEEADIYGLEPNASYRVEIQSVVDDFSADTDTTGVLAENMPVTGIFEIDGDQDWFRIELEAGILYSVDLEGAPTEMGTTNDTYLRGLYDSDGNIAESEFGQLGFNDDGGVGFNSRARFEVAQSGTYFIVADRFSPLNEQLNETYTISLTAFYDDFGNTVDTAGTLEIGTPVEASIDFNYDDMGTLDFDWLGTALEADVIYNFAATTPDTLSDPIDASLVLDVRTAEGQGMLPFYTLYEDEAFVSVPEASDVFVVVYHSRGDLLGQYQVEGTEVYRRTAAETEALAAGPDLNVVYREQYETYHATSPGETADLIFGTTRGDVFDGHEGADTLVGGGGNDLLVGDATLQGGVTVESAVQAYRGYELILGRAPDAAGHSAFSAWDVPMSDKASAMINSVEFEQRFGTLTNEAFVDHLYANLRGPEGAGDDPARDVMISFLDDAESSSYYFYYGDARAELAARFVNSQEAKNLFDEVATDYTLRNSQSNAVDEVFTMYHALLGRDPDQAGFGNWVSDMASGLDLSGLADNFLGSQEFARNGDMTDAEFAAHVLEGTSPDAPTQEALDYAQSVLAGGVDRADFAAAMVTLSEDAGLTDWMRALGGNDVLIGGTGNNILYGGQYSDKFVFNVGDGGIQKVKDFEDWDVIQLDGFGFETLAEARALFEQRGDNAVFEHQGTSIVLSGYEAANLTDDMILI